MTDSIAPIGHAGVGRLAAAPQVAAPMPSRIDADVLLARVHAGIAEARALGIEAQRAAEGSATSRGVDVEGVLLATRKADAAFRMLDAVRNAMAEAYARAGGANG